MRSDFSSNNIEIRATERLDSLNPLIANDELSHHKNLTILWTWIYIYHASLCNTLFSNKLFPKTVKILTWCE